MRDELAERIAAIPDHLGRPLGTKVFRPEDVYPEINGVAPDLIVHFGDLLWRSVGTIGGDDGIHTFENDTGPDDANHAQDGMIILSRARHRARAPRRNAPPGRRSDRARADGTPDTCHDARREPAGHWREDLIA